MKKICIQCDVEFNGHASVQKYCSLTCQQLFQRGVYIEKWKRGEVTGMKADGVASNHIWHYLFDEQKRGCEKCGFSSWEGNQIPLHLEHIDGDSFNNRPENLCLLCPCCHAQTTTYKGLNQGLGRLKASNEAIGGLHTLRGSRPRIHKVKQDHITERNMKIFIKDWLAGKHQFSENGYVNPYIRRYLLKFQQGECVDCQRSVWNGKEIALEMEHCNGRHRDNRPLNLCMVCPNCHALKPTSGSKNKGNGRPGRLRHEKKKNEIVKEAVRKMKEEKEGRVF